MTSQNSNHPLASRVVYLLLGGLLIGAAILKLAGQNVSPFAQYGWLSTPAVQILAVAWELLLGLWLISGAYRVGAWFAALFTFLAFAVVSGYLGSIGQARCGCFGAIEASPWHAFTIDLIALALLVWIRPLWSELASALRIETLAWPRGIAGTLLGAGLLLVTLLVGGSLAYGSPDAALARLRGVPLYVPGYVDFGESQAGEAVRRTAEFQNWSEQPIRLIGGTSDCSCLTTASMPVTIEPGERVEVPIELRVPASAKGVFTRRVEVWTDCEQRRKVALIIGCYIP